jgi:glycosyltransferase involved in cell wall biosynthesis
MLKSRKRLRKLRDGIAMTESTPRTIVHIAPTPFFSNRGCHIRIKNIVDALSTQNIRSVVCTYHIGDSPVGVDVRRIYPIKGYIKRDAGFSFYKFPADLLLLFLCLRVIWNEKPGVIYGHLHEGGLIGWIIKTVFFWRRIELVMDVQGSLSGELKAYGTLNEASSLLKIFRWIEGIICKLPVKITCSSVASKTSLVEDFRVKENVLILLPDVVGEGFMDVEGTKHKKDLGILLDQKIVLYSGSLLDGKGIQTLFQAIAILSQQRNDCHFVLIGYPVENANTFLESHGLQDRCTLTGEVKYSDLARYLGVGDIAVDPKAQNSGEASGKILHYMAAGLPVVCFDLPNNRSLLVEHGSYAVSVTAEGLASQLDEALNQLDEQKLKGLALQHLVKQHYTVSSSGKYIMEQFHDMMV